MSTAYKILLVDDEAAFQRLCGQWLASEGFEVSFAASHEQIHQQLANTKFDLVLLDLALPPEFSPELTIRLMPLFGDTPVVIMTGHAERELALQAIAQGAWDFMAKPLDPELLKVVIDRALIKRHLQLEVERLKANVDETANHLGILGSSQAIQQLRSLIRKIATSDVPVLINGDSGTGKELVAKALHQCSDRSEQAFVPVHCGAIPAELMESELFGHVKGAFTGAHTDRDGLIESANGGTLFLDEIGEMPLSMQVKLLRVLQDGSFYPVGSREQKQVNVRLVSATHQHLEQRITEGEFREDLYYRIRGLQLVTPNLAERLDDIPLLARYFASAQQLSIDDAAISWLVQHTWQGNVRELANLVHTAAALVSGSANKAIGVSDLQLAAGEAMTSEEAAERQSLEASLRVLELKLVVAALDATDNNHTHAAQRLGVSRAGLLKKMTKLGLR